MTIKLRRFESGEKQTLGMMEIAGRKIYTLELAWKNNQKKVSCIPVGDYHVVKRVSEKYGNHFHVTDVFNRDFILIHHGNYYTDILGCILVGFGLADINKDGLQDVTSSKKAMDFINKNLPNEFTLSIYNG